MLVAPDKVSAESMLVPHTSASVGLARDRVEHDLVTRGLSADVVDNSVLVVSEILSNALRHARPLPGGKVRLRWALEGHRLAVQVTDGGAATRPRVQPVRASSASGRGLGIVRRLATEWGVSEDGVETTVWAVIDLDERSVRRATSSF